MKSGQDVLLVYKEDKKFLGKISEVSNKPDEMSGFYRVVSNFLQANQLQKGDSVIALVVTSYGKKKFKIERSALYIGDGEHFVWTVDSENKAHRKKVQVSVIESTFVGVRDGLEEGEKVITSGWSKLKENDKVLVLKQGANS